MDQIIFNTLHKLALAVEVDLDVSGELDPFEETVLINYEKECEILDDKLSVA